MFFKFFYFEVVDGVVILVFDELVGEVNFDFVIGGCFGVYFFEVVFVFDGDGEYVVFEWVVEENVGKGRSNDVFDVKVV